MIITLIIAIITYLTQKKAGVSSSKAALGALAAGAGTYYVATQTDWGKANLLGLDTALGLTTGSAALLDSDGNTVSNPSTGSPLLGPTPVTTKANPGIINSIGSWLSDNMGTVAALGVGAAAGGSSWLIWALLAGGALILMK